jgi:outer membrane protein OmpA-like peptidoglycan-associated protein
MESRTTLETKQDSQWMSVSDLMSGLVLIFILLTISMIYEAARIQDRSGDINSDIDKIAAALELEFRSDLKKWDAEFNAPLLEFTYLNPEVLFDQGDSALKPEFLIILNDFLPRYLNVLDEFRDTILEIRIEGHTSTRWDTATSQQEAYAKNMDLSHRRTAAVLQYSYSLEEVQVRYFEWLSQRLVAVGMSSSKPIRDSDGREQESKSRRVTFRVITDAEQRLLCRDEQFKIGCDFSRKDALE